MWALDCIVHTVCVLLMFVAVSASACMHAWCGPSTNCRRLVDAAMRTHYPDLEPLLQSIKARMDR